MTAYHVRHVTSYVCDEPVSVGHNEAWLKPRELPHQRIVQFTLDIVPEPSIVSSREDYYGNTITVFAFNQGYDTLEVTVDCTVELSPHIERQLAAGADEPWEQVQARLDRPTSEEERVACEFRYDSPRIRTSPELADFAAQSFPPGRPIVEALRELTGRIHAEFQYDPSATTVSTPLNQVLENRRGVCQDFAHLQIGLLRSIGLSARYVSGYLRTYPPPGKPRLVGADASHAWLSVYCGPLGWIDFDPTNNLLPDTQHITLAWGRDYGDVSPLKGVFIGGGRCQLGVSVDVAAI